MVRSENSEGFNVWRNATWATLFRTKSGLLLLVSAALLTIVVSASANWYQASQFEIALSLASPVESNAGANSPKGFADANGAYGSVVALMLLTVGGSVLAAIVVSMLSKIQRMKYVLDVSSEFHLLVGNPTQKGKRNFLDVKVVVVVPRYTYEVPKLPSGRPTDERNMYVEVGGEKRKWKGGFTFNRPCDVRAAQIVQTRLKALSFRNVEIVSDADSAEKFAEAECEIHLGLHHNGRLTEILGAMSGSRLFDVTDEGVRLAIVNGAGHIVCGAEDSEATLFKPGDAAGEVMLIGKLRHAGKSHIVLGGLTDWGVINIAEKFFREINSLPGWGDYGSNLKEGQEVSFVALYRATGSSDEPFMEKKVVVPSVQSISRSPYGS